MLSDHSNVLPVNTFLYFIFFCIFLTFRFIGALYFPCPQSLRKKKTKQKKAMQSCPCCGDYSLSLPVVTAGLWGQMSIASANGSEVQELETEQAAAVTSEPRPALAVGCTESGVGSPSPHTGKLLPAW